MAERERKKDEQGWGTTLGSPKVRMDKSSSPRGLGAKEEACREGTGGKPHAQSLQDCSGVS